MRRMSRIRNGTCSNYLLTLSGTKLVTTTRCWGTRTGFISIVNREKVDWSFVSLKTHKSKCQSSKNTCGVVTVLTHEDMFRTNRGFMEIGVKKVGLCWENENGLPFCHMLWVGNWSQCGRRRPAGTNSPGGLQKRTKAWRLDMGFSLIRSHIWTCSNPLFRARNMLLKVLAWSEWSL